MNLYNIIPAIRMILSKGSTSGVVRFINAENNVLKDFCLGNENISIYVKGNNEEDILKQIVDISEKKDIHYIAIEDFGLNIFHSSSLMVSVLVSFFKNRQPGESLVLPVAKKLENRRVEQKVVIVTGGAMGFGEGIVDELFEEGANIVIADLNEEKGKEKADHLNKKEYSNQAYFVNTDVSDPDSVKQLVEKTVYQFGGLDTMISNAGILRAGSLDEMDAKTFEIMTKVNYSGYFYCAKYASAVMKVQSKYSSEKYFDIIQINSKSGLKGSNKNFAYAGGKFGGIGLTQSFALELMPDRIKVNSICPGNFFDGPLWSDPENGLFVQYLNAGKVPGAKSIADVKKFYEGQVPAKRGCRVIDVVRAIYYVMEQEYETGQAIPVTGGQNMLN